MRVNESIHTSYLEWCHHHRSVFDASEAWAAQDAREPASRQSTGMPQLVDDSAPSMMGQRGWGLLFLGWCVCLKGLPGGDGEIRPRLVPRLTQGHMLASEWDCLALGFQSNL